MLNKLIAFFNNELQVESEENKAEQIQQACAVLLIEVSKADYEECDNEREAIRASLSAWFDLPDTKLAELIQLGEEQSKESISMYPFVKLINENYQYEQRVELLSKMWQVAYADNVISKYEDFIIRKIADLLHISHSDFIKTKLNQGSQV